MTPEQEHRIGLLIHKHVGIYGSSTAVMKMLKESGALNEIISICQEACRLSSAEDEILGAYEYGMHEASELIFCELERLKQ